MSTITYKCNVCKREIAKLENIRGLTVFAKCIITEGCRGNLYKIGRDPNNIRETFPAAKAGVRDFFPRKSLYVHDQEVSATEWRIFHDLSVVPSISIYETTDAGTTELNQDEYTVSIIDGDALSVTFLTAKYGVAHCVAKSSVPIKAKVVEAPPVPTQVSSDGTLVFGVPEYITRTETTHTVRFNTEGKTIRLQLEAIRPNEEPVICFEELDGDLNETPWVGWDTILIRNRRTYNLKAKRIDDFRTFIGTEIPNGTLIKFIGIDYGDGYLKPEDDRFDPIQSRGLFSMLSVPPFESVDKIKNALIDVGEMIKTKDDYFIYTNGELYTNDTNVETSYPDIKDSETLGGPKPTPTMTPSATMPATPAATPPGTPPVTPLPTPPVTPEPSQEVDTGIFSEEFSEDFG